MRENRPIPLFGSSLWADAVKEILYLALLVKLVQNAKLAGC